MKFEFILFIVLSIAAVFTAIMMITRRNPVISVIYLIINFFTVSGIYLLLKAQFIAIIQVLVYMGAIMVLFLFVIMLLNIKDEKKLSENFGYKKITALLLTIALASFITLTMYYGFDKKINEISPRAEQNGIAEYLGRQLFTSYSFPVIIAGLILLAAIIGAVVLAKKKFE